MRRRDYELIAQAMRNAKPARTAAPGVHLGWLRTVEAVGSALELDNSGFDYQLWLHNCGVTPT